MHTQPHSHRHLVTPHLDGAAAADTTLTLTLMDPAHEQRRLVEAFVSVVFKKAYGATLSTFYPLLLGLTHDDSGDYAAVAGVRPAGAATLFSEHYLERPVEQILAAPRTGIAEIGNLAPASAGQARWLICTLSAFLMGANFTHVVFTSVPRLRNAFSRMGLPLTHLADAHRECLPPEQQMEWGSYYDCKPAVYAGDIVAGTPSLLTLLTADPELQALAQRAYDAGRALTGHGPATLI